MCTKALQFRGLSAARPCRTRYGEGLKNSVVNVAGDFIFIPPDVPHQPFNLSDTEPAIAIVARNDPNRAGARSTLSNGSAKLRLSTAVCTENLNPDVVVMKSAKDRV